MNRLILLAGLVCACSHARPGTLPAGPPIQSSPFNISTINEPLFIRASIAGRVDVYPNIIVVTAYPDTLISHARKAAATDRDPEVLAGLASGDPDGAWQIDHRSDPKPLAALQAASVHHGRDSVQFVVRDVDAKMLRGHWIVFEFAFTATDARTRQRTLGYTYLHTRRDIFGQ